MNNQITVTIIGNPESSHNTVVEYNGQYYEFWTDGYDGTESKDVIAYLKFLGFEVFEVYKTNGSKKIYPVNNQYGTYI